MWYLDAVASILTILLLFQVPVSSRSGSHPFSLDVPPNIRYLFNEKTNIPAKSVANAIVSLMLDFVFKCHFP